MGGFGEQYHPYCKPKYPIFYKMYWIDYNNDVANTL